MVGTGILLEVTRKIRPGLNNRYGDQSSGTAEVNMETMGQGIAVNNTMPIDCNNAQNKAYHFLGDEV